MTTFKEYDSFDGLGLANLVQHGVISPTELLEAAIERIELMNPHINAVIHAMYDEAYSTIKNTLPRGLFQGVPFLLKDLISDYAGAPLTMGSRFTRDFISFQDSELVKRFKQAGLVILGKTNVPEFGLSPVTEPILFGPTRNPWDLSRTSGGSSGGSAAAVATRMVPIAHGGDGAGSLRTPAAYCGVFGFKPSRGRTPVGPKLLRLWLGMITEHVITRSVRDSAAMLDVTTGVELGSPISMPKPKESFLSCLNDRPSTLRIAMTDKPFFPATLDAEYSSALQDAGRLCQQLGHDVEWTSITLHHEDVTLALLIIMSAELTADLNLLSHVMKKKLHVRELEIPTAVLYKMGSCFSAEDFAWAVQTLDSVSRQFAEFFQRYDVLMTPTMAMPPPAIGYLQPGKTEQFLLTIMSRLPRSRVLRELVRHGSKKTFSFIPFTPVFNITGQPAMSVPLAWDKKGLPIGIQFAAPIGEDVRLLQLAQQLEYARPWSEKRPVILD